MDSNFATSLALVLKSEGGWSDNPKDPGGATMKGVTLANFRRYVKADATKADLKKISNDQIATVYRRFYWDAVAGAQLPAGVDYCVFDYGVNSGPGRGAKALQSVVNVVVDGRIGPATLAALVKLDPHVVIDSVCDQRMAFLKRLPTWDTFGRGWSDRVKSVRAAAHAMASAPVQKTVAVSLPPVTPPSVAAALPAEPASNATVLTVDGPKQDETTVVIAKTPQAPPAPAAPPSSKTGIIALGALIMTLLAGVARYVFGG